MSRLVEKLFSVAILFTAVSAILFSDLDSISTKPFIQNAVTLSLGFFLAWWCWRGNTQGFLLVFVIWVLFCFQQYWGFANSHMLVIANDGSRLGAGWEWEEYFFMRSNFWRMADESLVDWALRFYELVLLRLIVFCVGILNIIVIFNYQFISSNVL